MCGLVILCHLVSEALCIKCAKPLFRGKTVMEFFCASIIIKSGLFFMRSFILSFYIFTSQRPVAPPNAWSFTQLTGTLWDLIMKRVIVSIIRYYWIIIIIIIIVIIIIIIVAVVVFEVAVDAVVVVVVVVVVMSSPPCAVGVNLATRLLRQECKSRGISGNTLGCKPFSSSPRGLCLSA